MRFLPRLALCGVLLSLSGCAGAFNPFQRAGNWSATGAANETIAQQAAYKSDLLSGRATPGSNGMMAVGPVKKTLNTLGGGGK